MNTLSASPFALFGSMPFRDDIQANVSRMMARRKPAPAKFCGVQSGFGFVADIELFNLTADIPGHNEGSTVSRATLEAAGFRVPRAE